jgi:putative transposase
MVQNYYLAKSILDASWNNLIQYSSYKASNGGKEVIQINPNGTAQECSRCKPIVPKSLSERVHRCPNCGLKLDRDYDSALDMQVRIGRALPN